MLDVELCETVSILLLGFVYGFRIEC